MAHTNRGDPSSMMAFDQASTSLEPDVPGITQRLISSLLSDLIGLVPLKMYFSASRTVSLLFLPITTVLASFPAFSLPAPIGPYKVGLKTVYLPNAPLKRDLMVSIFYPTISSISTPFAPAFDPALAAFLDNFLGLPSGLFGSLKTKAYTAAPLSTSCKTPPVVLFSPGWAESRQEYAGSMSNLASNGYIVVGVDHPYDTRFISYPDGRNITFSDPSLDTATEEELKVYYAAVTERRVSDIRFVLDTLSSKTALLPGQQGKWDISKGVGIFGHSLGGAAAAATISADKRFKCGADLDGTFWGPVVTKGVQEIPFMIMSSQNYNSSVDASWASFWKASNPKGALELEVSVKGAEHFSYSDVIVWFNKFVDAGLMPPNPALYGEINPERMLTIENAYVTALFNYCTTGTKAKVLKGPTPQFPEVKYALVK